MDLSAYKVTLPIASDYTLSGNAIEFQGADIAEGKKYFWFENHADKVVFRTPDYGALTPSTTSPRSELRHLTDFLVSQASSLSIRTAVIACKEDKGLTIAQLYPWVKIVYRDGLVRAFVKPTDTSEDTKIILGTVDPSDIMNIGFAYDGSKNLTISLDGYDVIVEMTRTGTYFYKHGAYPSDSDGDGFVYEVENYPVV